MKRVNFEKTDWDQESRLIDINPKINEQKVSESDPFGQKNNENEEFDELGLIEENIEDDLLMNSNKNDIKDLGLSTFIYRSSIFRLLNPYAKILTKNRIFIITMYILTFYILFFDFIKIIFFDNRVDLAFDIITIFALVLFVVEIVATVFTNPFYLRSYFFIFDCIMTVGIIFNIEMVSNKIFFNNSSANAQNIINKIVKFIRLMRIIRIQNFFKSVSIDENSKGKPVRQSEKESKVTIHLRERIIKRLLLLIMIMWIVVPLMDFDIYKTQRILTNRDKIMITINNFLYYPQSITGDELVKDLNESIKGNSNEELAKLYIKDYIDFETEGYTRLRPSEKKYYQEDIKIENRVLISEIAISERKIVIIQAALDLVTTILLAIIMLFSVWELNNNMKKLILIPLERMIEKIKQVSLDPLAASKAKKNDSYQDEEMNEALTIEESINKISELLILGFGQAGCQIISKSLFEVNKEIEDVFSGEKTYGIFGFCYVTQFNQLTEILQEDIIVFVNTIAEMVHLIVDDHYGAANKNLGDAFLFTWKLKDDGYKYLQDSNFRQNYLLRKNESSNILKSKLEEENNYNRQIAEMSLISFIKIVIEINSSKVISDYSRVDAIQKVLPGYRVKMGLGLHVGWAIEGAIGSTFKIDASYLSPNVNMAARLEAATKQFGVEILFSGPLFSLFNDKQLIDISRHIDTVNVKGSKEPMKFYTIDLNLKNLKERKKTTSELAKSIKPIKLKLEDGDTRRALMAQTKRFSMESQVTSKLFESQLPKIGSLDENSMTQKKLKDPVLASVLEINNENNRLFRHVFRFGINSYLQGEWKLAKNFLERCSSLKSTDKPTLVILNYMAKFNFKAPDTWKGCRELTEK